jgi:hypothetical protein
VLAPSSMYGVPQLSFSYLAQQIFNRPLAIRPEKAEIIMAALADRLGIARLRTPDGRIRAFDGDIAVMADGQPVAPPSGAA